MIRSFNELKSYIHADRKRYDYSIKKYIIGRILYDDSSHAIRLLKYLRFTEYCYYKKNNNFIWRIIYLMLRMKYSRLQFKYDVHIGLNICGPGLWIPHMGGIIINCVCMGENCSVNKGVVIGNRKGNNNRAKIGDNCYLLLGAKIIGNVSIGNNVIVAQNTVVVKDIDNNSIVSGIPARLLKRYENIEDIKI